MSTASSYTAPPSCLTLPGTLLWSHGSLPLSLLINSGADDNFLDEGLARQARIPIEGLATPRTILDLKGKPIAEVTHQTELLSLVISGNHREHISLYLIPSSAASAVLGSPWLARPNPQFNWVKGTLTGCSVACHLRCLHSALSPSPRGSPQQPELPDLSKVPELYRDLADVFRLRLPSPD